MAVISDGSTPTQRTVRTTLAGLAQAVADEGIRPPAVWVVGDVVGLTAGAAVPAADDDEDTDEDTDED